ncbi:hypothetical protein ACFX4Y_13815 [Priestia sp. YIM B13446]|uniref:hypothetical protein n=1 Tax=unclassified Priestia TaxID=2800374 RepID=UPI003670CB56
MGNLGIVVIGYNRLNNLERILNRLNKCYYGKDKVTLIISLDNSGMKSLAEFAKKFKWLHGEKYIKTFPERLGLRKHVFTCGNYLNEFDLEAISVFEDDIFPSSGFYNYMKQSIKYYKDDDRIAGISLYKHMWNVNANAPFETLYNSDSDVYFMQFAQSWGQIWMRKQWNDFYQWYLKNDTFIDNYLIPETVSNWPETSWLKYHVKYCIENEKFFVYPYHSLTTCFSEEGEHAVAKSTTFQVPLEQSFKKAYKFQPLDKNAVAYDAFFESLNISNSLKVDNGNLIVDLYGTKRKFLRGSYVLSTRTLNEPIIKTYGLELKPMEMNVSYDIEGHNIFLYHISSDRLQNRNESELLKWIYFHRTLPNWKTLLQIVKFKIKFLTKLITKKGILTKIKF